MEKEIAMDNSVLQPWVGALMGLGTASVVGLWKYRNENGWRPLDCSTTRSRGRPLAWPFRYQEMVS